MRILIVHQFLWSHYKAGIFQNIEKLIAEDPDSQLHIIQTAKYEKSRLDFGEADTSVHQYKYELLFDDVYENTGLLSRVKKVFHRIRKFKPDVINLPGYYEPAMILIHFISKTLGIKVILSIDSTEGDNPNKWYGELIKKMIIRAADGFFCYGTMAADYMLKLGASEDEILMRRNSVNNSIIRSIHDKFKTTPEYLNERINYPKYNFIYVGRFLDIKNIELLVKAFKEVSADSDWGLLLVGDGPHKPEILKAIGTSKNIFIMPPQPWHGVPERMAYADVLVLPSYSEPWGLVTNEAMVCGKPVIVSSKCGSSKDLVINGKNGFTFDAYQLEDLKEKLSFFINSPERLPEMGIASEEKIKEFSPERVAQDMYHGFKKVVG
ncbi:glycosyltransferase family 4 protein [Jiulongibacter sp. NS-SX5]|uniref:glycosyltransferase family 4 protein n=1 Tax=Jiulongibacter sp. NS-SX5 TaxID=3463854 RepID=UPI004057F61B